MYNLLFKKIHFTFDQRMYSYQFITLQDRAWGDHWEEAIGDKMELNPHIPKPEPPVEEKEEEKKEAEEAADDNKKEEDKEKVIT